VLLLHQLGQDRHDFDQVWMTFQNSGISTLALDFRGHGDSDPAAVELEALLTDPDQLRHDVAAGLAFLASQEAVDPNRIGVMGVSVGANMAVVANHRRQEWGVKSICAISARLERVQDLAETVELDLANALYVAAVDEHPQAEDADALFNLTEEPKDLEIVLGTAAHGADLLQASVDAQNGTVAWFESQL